MDRYSVTVYRGGKPAAWKWADTVEVPVKVSVVTNDQLKHQIAPIIFLDGAPTKWAKLGIDHDPVAGTLDFSNYTLADDGEIAGDIDFMYLDV
ncbi:hypothetical protein JST56_07035 [Candidatus Dependentiae bacterium]|nr:hypothetical protein [Candidatus Dependentiae bacterium]